ncbi:hypothetical protein [Pseudomonas anguilliseptica]
MPKSGSLFQTIPIQVNGTAVYIRVYQRVGETDRYDPINLNIAAV